MEDHKSLCFLGNRGMEKTINKLAGFLTKAVLGSLKNDGEPNTFWTAGFQ